MEFRVGEKGKRLYGEEGCTQTDTRPSFCVNRLNREKGEREGQKGQRKEEDLTQNSVRSPRKEILKLESESPTKQLGILLNIYCKHVPVLVVVNLFVFTKQETSFMPLVGVVNCSDYRFQEFLQYLYIIC